MDDDAPTAPLWYEDLLAALGEPGEARSRAVAGVSESFRTAAAETLATVISTVPPRFRPPSSGRGDPHAAPPAADDLPPSARWWERSPLSSVDLDVMTSTPTNPAETATGIHITLIARMASTQRALRRGTGRHSSSASTAPPAVALDGSQSVEAPSSSPATDRPHQRQRSKRLVAPTSERAFLRQERIAASVLAHTSLCLRLWVEELDEADRDAACRNPSSSGEPRVPPVVPALFFVGRLRGMLAICVPAEALTRVSGDEADAPVNACVALDARTQRDHGSASTLHGIEWTAMRRCGGARDGFVFVVDALLAFLPLARGFDDGRPGALPREPLGLGRPEAERVCAAVLDADDDPRLALLELDPHADARNRQLADHLGLLYGAVVVDESEISDDGTAGEPLPDKIRREMSAEYEARLSEALRLLCEERRPWGTVVSAAAAAESASGDGHGELPPNTWACDAVRAPVYGKAVFVAGPGGAAVDDSPDDRGAFLPTAVERWLHERDADSGTEERTDVGPSVVMGGTEGGREDAEAEAEAAEAEEKPVPVMVENFVRAVLVPQFGASFTHQSKDVIRSWDLVAKMQDWGISYCDLGRVRSCVDSPRIANLLFIEMICHVIEADVSAAWACEARGQLSDEEPYRAILVSHLNAVLDRSPESDAFWRVILKARLMLAFEGALTEPEMGCQHDPRQRVQRFTLLRSVAHRFGIKFTAEAEGRLLASSSAPANLTTGDFGPLGVGPGGGTCTSLSSFVVEALDDESERVRQALIRRISRGSLGAPPPPGSMRDLRPVAGVPIAAVVDAAQQDHRDEREHERRRTLSNGSTDADWIVVDEDEFAAVPSPDTLLSNRSSVPNGASESGSTGRRRLFGRRSGSRASASGGTSSDQGNNKRDDCRIS